MTTPSLPPHVYLERDRHGKARYRFVRKGWKRAYLHGEPGSAEFHAGYAALLAGGPVDVTPAKAPGRVVPRSLDDLFRRHKTTLRWAKKAERTKLVQGRMLDRFMDRRGKQSGARFGERPVASVTVAWLEKLLAEMSETPAAANVLRKVLAGLMDTAVRLGWRQDNPVRFTDSYADGEGFHDWTDAEIEQYRAHHKLGTMARLTLELALNTAGRRCNVHRIERDDIAEGRITVAHAKDNNAATVPVLLSTQAALDALPATPIRYLITTQFGKPFTVAGLGNRVRKWCDEAGLPKCSLHGLRKAMSRQLAESGATDAQGMAVTGHKKDRTFQYYRSNANRAALATAAMGLIEASKVPNLTLQDSSEPRKNHGKSDV